MPIAEFGAAMRPKYNADVSESSESSSESELILRSSSEEANAVKMKAEKRAKAQAEADELVRTSERLVLEERREAELKQIRKCLPLFREKELFELCRAHYGRQGRNKFDCAVRINELLPDIWAKLVEDKEEEIRQKEADEDLMRTLAEEEKLKRKEHASKRRRNSGSRDGSVMRYRSRRNSRSTSERGRTEKVTKGRKRSRSRDEEKKTTKELRREARKKKSEQTEETETTRLERREIPADYLDLLQKVESRDAGEVGEGGSIQGESRTMRRRAEG